MKERFSPGKVPWDVIAEKVKSDLPPEVVLGPALGEDAAIIRMGGDLWAVASDPITFAATGAGRLSVAVNANDIAVRGARPLYYTVVVLVSPQEAGEEYIGSLLDEIRGACVALGITLIGGHTEVSPGLPRTVIVGTMLGKVIGEPLTTGGLRDGNLVGMTKWAGIEGTSVLLSDFKERLYKIHGAGAFGEIEKTLSEDWISVVPEAAIAAACRHVTALHDVTEGGIGEALYEMAIASGLHIQVPPERVPVLPATRLLCSDFGIDPLGLLGSGSLLIGCASEGKEDLEKALAEHGIPFSWLGEAKHAKDDTTIMVPRFSRDEILKAWVLEGVEGIVFDMDGTLIDSDYDWQAIRAELGVTGASIVDDLNGFEDGEREKKWERLREIEREATLAARLHDGCGDLIAVLREHQLKTALVTNNAEENVSYLLEKFALSFDVVISRDSGLYKPSGAPIAEAVRRLGISPKRTLCVGDSPYDIMASRDAGCGWVCILFDEKNIMSPNADLSFRDIRELRRYLQIVL